MMDHNIKMIETWAMRYEQTKEQHYLELLERSKTALNKTLTLQNEALFYLNIKDAKQRAVLEAIKELITQDLADPQTIYEQIYNLTCKGLESSEDDRVILGSPHLKNLVL